MAELTAAAAAADDADDAAPPTRFPTGLRDQTAPADEPWLFVQLADPQLGMHNSDQAAAGWSEEQAMLDLAVDKINAMKPAFVIVCGDLIHEFPEHVGETDEDPERAARQTRAFQRSMGRVRPDVGLVCLCGNHDVGNVPTRASVGLFRERYGADTGAFRCGGTRCVVLNSQLVNAREAFWRARKPQVAEAEALADAQDAFLDALEPAPTLVFSHVPPFIYSPDEPKGYFNHEPAVRRPLLDRVRRLDPRAKWFTGHFHRNAGGFDGELEVVVTAAAGCVLGWRDDPTRDEKLGLAGFDWSRRRCDADHSGMRCVCVRPGGDVRHKFFAMACVPEDPIAASEGW